MVNTVKSEKEETVDELLKVARSASELGVSKEGLKILESLTLRVDSHEDDRISAPSGRK